MCELFSAYIVGTDAAIIFLVLVKYMYFYQIFFAYGVFSYLFVIFTSIFFVYFCLKTNERIDIGKLKEKVV